MISLLVKPEISIENIVMQSMIETEKDLLCKELQNKQNIFFHSLGVVESVDSVL